MSMEPSSWVVPCYSGWSMEEAAAAWSSEDRISFQTSLPSHSDSVQLQVVEYASPATPTHDTCSDADQVFEEAAQVFNDDYFLIMGKKMHRFPPSLVDVGDRYRVPVTVAIGPYHHGQSGLMEAEQVKHAAANQCIRDSSGSLQEMYTKVSSVSDVARKLYRHDDVATFGHREDFVPMMFLDACFLVQFMLSYVDSYVVSMDMALNRYFCANFERISTDIMMLENQIPWVVVEAIFHFMHLAPSPWPWEDFVAAMRSGLKNRIDPGVDQGIVVVPTYEPPHLLGLVRYYIVGNNDDIKVDRPTAPSGDKPMSLSISVAELADVGITLVPEKEKSGLVHMTLQKKRLVDTGLGGKKFGFLFGDLRVPPLFPGIGKNMRLGKCYIDIMIDIENFKDRMSWGLTSYLFLDKHWPKIVAVATIIAAVIGILSSLQALKPH
ncbi:hypothetical protein CFC21_009784 [Triticum aestivum]|uniref:Uncharacterized protein n=2 Tax=Triticum aestivum TaxID=4565 RepID=A0A3B5ZMX4_WHEAT|nr:UPF0481 protein At3g47200-like [Triticum aestivum]KAF6992824.1 hypothetical protein CFC21_009784 [Triticum aestivum]